ncbi:MAG: response regulator transcription factor [Chitinophagales bacterium]|nr:response regulator transcription factor [Bacteroidota bacterium]MCB9257133.1 response regulator transcription factor [Chitinophagales bacterium]
MKELKILYVEDDPSLAFITKEELSAESYQVVHCADGEEAIKEFEIQHFDMAILDIMLPKVDGFAIATHIRKKNEEMPILFLSAKSLEEDRLKGFSIGADDYLTKPFSMDELLFKIKVFLKRRKLLVEGTVSSFEIGKYSFEPNNLLLKCEDYIQELTAKEADLLALFVASPKQTIKREDILVKLWGKNDYFLGRSLDVFISRLRKYLSKDAAIEIQTVRGVGFRMEY